MYCGKCGYRIENEQAHFCPKCGAPLPKPTATGAPVPGTPGKAVPPSVCPPEPAPETPKKRRHPLRWLIVCVLILILAAAACLAADSRLHFLPDSLSGLLPGSGRTSSETVPASGSDTPETALQMPVPTASAAPQPTPTPVTTATPAPSPAVIAADQVALRGLPGDTALTVNGTAVSFDVVGSDLAVDAALLTAPCQIRAVVSNGDGSYKTAVFFYESTSGRDLNFSTLSWQTCSADGFAAPTADLLNTLARDYYGGFLAAINAGSLDRMVYSTDANTTDQTEHVFSDANTKNTWDTETYTCALDENSITVSDTAAVFNVTFSAYRTRNNSGEKALNTNHRTIRAVWENGMWKVDRIAFLSDSDFAARKYADLG